MCEEIERAGHTAHLADPAETAARRGRKKRAKTDNADCDLMLELLLDRRLPESWIAPAHILELRTLVRTRKTLLDQRTAWQHRLNAQLFDQGVPPGLRLRTVAGRAAVAQAELTAAGHELVALGLRMIDRLDNELAPLDRTLAVFARRQPGCRALISQLYEAGVEWTLADFDRLGDKVPHLADLKPGGRFVMNDLHRAGGKLSRQAPQTLRWALYEAAQAASRASSPDHGYYLQVRTRIDHNRACLSVARKLRRRAYHILRALGDDALAPITAPPTPEEAARAA